jgi:hypothetical protein
MPHLAFETGGSSYQIEFVNSGKAVPGIDPKYAIEAFKDIPDDARSITLKTGPNGEILQEYGKLKNYGTGPALSTEVCWIANKVQIGQEIFEITNEKKLEPKYSKEMNRIPSSPSHILSGETAKFFRFPTFIQKDFEKKIKEVKGILEINCVDVFNENHTTYQKFYIFTDYDKDIPRIYFTFGDMLKVSLS